MRRVAAIDCGTNSIRLLVADVDAGSGALVDLDRQMQIVRLGQGVDRTGHLAPEALQRTFAACEEYAAVIRRLGADATRFVATSASRDADNRAEFIAGVLASLGVEPEVVSGGEEARLSFTGATRGLAGVRRRRTSSSTSVAARPSSCSATTSRPGSWRRAASTSAACG